MTSQEFTWLQEQIEEIMGRLEELQQFYIKETGKRYVRGQGISKGQENRPST